MDCNTTVVCVYVYHIVIFMCCALLYILTVLLCKFVCIP